MKTKQSIIGTFFINITIVIISSLIILLTLWLYSLIFDRGGANSFFHYLATISSIELLLVFIFAIITTFIVTRLIARDLKKHFALFNAYFQDASKKLKKIDTNKLYFREFEELALSVNEMVDDIQNSKEEVLKHKSYLQAVLESQRNIVFVMEESEIVSVNKAFLEFFSVKSITDFYNKYEKVCDTFMKDDGYLQCRFDDSEWKEFVINNPTMIHKVKLKSNNELYVFVVDVAPVEDGKSGHLVLSFTDITELENERKLFEVAASTDALTGIANRLKFNTILEQQIALSRRYKEPFSLILYDIDDFKRVNDTYGHHIGDQVLVALTNNVSQSIRESDTFARWGGEEFAIILPQTKKPEAIELAEKIRKNVEALSFAEGFKLTCSFGVKEYEDDLSSDVFIQGTDVHLYQAKKQGKNRVCC